MNIPKELRYTKDHEWAKLDGKIMTIGITDFAQGELGDIIFVEFPEVGQDVTIGDPFGTIEAVKTVADIFSPVNGTITEVNEDIEDAPDNINTDPYGKGWLVKIEINGEPEDLLSSDVYEELIKS